MDFGSKLLLGLDAAVKADLEPDRVVKIQILALMHLHNDGQGGADRSARYLTQAITEAWALLLHFKDLGDPDQEKCDYLWWSLRNLDRLNKLIMGAGPFIIDDTDVAIKRIAAKKGNYRSQLMGVSLIMGDLMATATKIYKGSSTATTDGCHEFPTLAALTSDYEFDQFHKSHRDYFQIWYHVTAMLSCRHNGPDSVQYNRRLASADQILRIMTSESHDNLPPLPLIPYATSMATTVIYRALCDGRRDIITTCNELRLCCDILEALGQQWTAAQGMAKLTTWLWRSIESRAKDQGVIDSDHNDQQGWSRETGTDAVRNTQSPVQQRARMAESDESLIPTPVSILEPDQTLGRVPPAHNQHTYQGLYIEPWLNTNAPNPHFNELFNHAVDYGISDMFRDPASWELFHVASNQPPFDTYSLSWADPEFT